MNYYLVFHIVAGFYIVDWFYSYMDEKAREAGETFGPDDVKETMACFILWPIVVPVMLIIFNWPWRNNEH